MALQIIADYEDLRPHLAGGLLVLPDTVDLHLWHGAVIVHSGRYADGIFRFVVCIHPSYPAVDARPLVVLLDRPYHPLVDPDTGLLQLDVEYPTWRAADRLPLVVEFVRNVLTNDRVIEPRGRQRSFNPAAADL